MYVLNAKYCTFRKYLYNTFLNKLAERMAHNCENHSYDMHSQVYNVKYKQNTRISCFAVLLYYCMSNTIYYTPNSIL